MFHMLKFFSQHVIQTSLYMQLDNSHQKEKKSMYTYYLKQSCYSNSFYQISLFLTHFINNITFVLFFTLHLWTIFNTSDLIITITELFLLIDGTSNCMVWPKRNAHEATGLSFKSSNTHHPDLLSLAKVF